MLGTVQVAEPGPNGQPNLQATRRLIFSKAAAASPSSKSGQDGQVSQFLARNAWCGFTYNRNAWCGFTYNKNTGTSTKERVVFYSNGTVARTSGAETYNSGPAGSVAGQHGNANQGRWKVAQGKLHLSQDGTNWTPQQLQVTQNSNGYPIIKSGGKEYMQCN